jgi:ABC-2 type transport system permease protein/capsular polysaccharide transport system permease protein
MYHRNVKVADIFFARLLLEGGGATISFAVLSAVFIAAGVVDPPEDVLQVVGGWIMMAWFGVSLALLMGSLAQEFEVVDKLWHPAAYLLFPLSGAAFLVDAMPPVAQHYLLYLPMVHGTEYIREGYFGSRIRAHHDLGYMALFNASMLILALAQLRKVSREVIPE